MHEYIARLSPGFFHWGWRSVSIAKTPFYRSIYLYFVLYQTILPKGLRLSYALEHAAFLSTASPIYFLVTHVYIHTHVATPQTNLPTCP